MVAHGGLSWRSSRECRCPLTRPLVIVGTMLTLGYFAEGTTENLGRWAAVACAWLLVEGGVREVRRRQGSGD